MRGIFVTRQPAVALRKRTQVRRWTLVATLAFTETTSYGVLYYAFTVFLKPMQAELGWSRTTVTGAFSLALLISGVAGLAVGFWLDRHGPHALMTVGSCGAAVLVFAWSQVHSVLAFYVIWAGLGCAMAMTLYEPAFWVVARWFPSGRARALTVLTFLAGFASVIYVPLAGWLTRVEGWRGALVILAVIVGCATIPAHALVLRGSAAPRQQITAPSVAAAGNRLLASADNNAPVEVNDHAAVLGDSGTASIDGVARREALRSLTFWGITTAFFLINLSSAALTTNLVPLLTDRGYALVFATSIAGLLGALSLPGRLIFTPLGDHFRRSWVTASLFLFQALGLLLLLLAPGEGAIIAFAALFGMGFGAITPARADLIADIFGRAHYGEINSAVALAITLARALGPLGMSLVYDHSGGYSPALVALIAAAIIGGGTLVASDARARSRLPRRGV